MISSEKNRKKNKKKQTKKALDIPNYKLEQSAKIEITANSGMFLFAEMLKKINFCERDDIGIKFIITSELNAPIRTRLES